MFPTISLCMIVKNEAEAIERCLSSVHGLVDEIVIVDTGSTDNTKTIATKFGAKIYDFRWNDNFSDARNYSLCQSESDWSLILDADEYVNKGSIKTLHNFISDQNAIGRVKLVNKFDLNGTVSFSQTWISRLIPRGCRFEGVIHEQVKSDLPRLKVDLEVYHDGYYQGYRSDRNLKMLLAQLTDFPNHAYFHYQIAKEYTGISNHLAAYEHLAKAYALLTGSESFYPSFVVNYMYSMVNSGNLQHGLEVMDRHSSMFGDYPDFHFVSGIFLMHLILSNVNKYASLLPMIEKSYLKCLEIGESAQYDSVWGTGSFTALYNLGTFYETTGKLNQALDCYRRSASMEYKPAIDRLKKLTENGPSSRS